mmetsp:Transcript_17370/g.50715  ORF Transcript_17370/g.50715 Transcript_17370/m.50715 type:complete len:432 (-) Transcript_17370:57-1352(-)
MESRQGLLRRLAAVSASLDSSRGALQRSQQQLQVLQGSGKPAGKGRGRGGRAGQGRGRVWRRSARGSLSSESQSWSGSASGRAVDTRDTGDHEPSSAEPAAATATAAASAAALATESRAALRKAHIDLATGGRVVQSLASQHAQGRGQGLAAAKTARASANRKRQLCVEFHSTGRCSRGKNCAWVHDRKQIAVCRAFLRGKCAAGAACPLSHDTSRADQMPVCSAFLKGSCTDADCRYRHVKVNIKAATCEAFLQGRCKRGDQCPLKHELRPGSGIAGTRLLHKKQQSTAQSRRDGSGNNKYVLDHPTEPSSHSSSSTLSPNLLGARSASSRGDASNGEEHRAKLPKFHDIRRQSTDDDESILPSFLRRTDSAAAAKQVTRSENIGSAEEVEEQLRIEQRPRGQAPSQGNDGAGRLELDKADPAVRRDYDE